MKHASYSRFALGLSLEIAMATALVLAHFTPARGEDAQPPSDTPDLLAGQDLSQHWTTSGNWVLEGDGVVTLKPRAGESGWQRYDAYLWLKGDDVQDFRCEFQYRVQKGSNSGFYFHVGDKKSPVATGVEVQIYDSFGKPQNAKLTDHDSGGIIPGAPPMKNSAQAPGQWNRMVVTSQGSKLTVVLNDVVVNEVDLNNENLRSRPKTGAIGFQDHGLPLSLRKFKLKKL